MKKIARLLGAIPSLHMIPGGAIPVFFFVNTILGNYRYPKQVLQSFLLASLFLILFVPSVTNLLDYLSFLVGPLFFVSYLVFDFKNIRYKYFIFILMADAFLGYLFSFGNDRSITFIGNEPSHIARYFFVLAIFSAISSKKYLWIILSSLFYVIFNKSFTSLLFMGYLVLFVFGKLKAKTKLAFYGLFLIIIIVASLSSSSNARFMRQLNTVASIDFDSFSNNKLGVLTAMGSRRLTQTYIGFALSQPFEGVGIGRSGDTFRIDAVKMYPELKNFSNIYERGNLAPTSYMANLFYEMGYVNACIFFIILMFPMFISNSFKLISRRHFMFGIFQLFLFSTNVFVIPWMFLAMSFEKGLRYG